MNRTATTALLLVLATTAARAEEPAPTYQKESPFRILGDAEFRQEWTEQYDFRFVNPDRRFIRLRPRVEARWKTLTLGLGGDFIYSSDDNTEPPAGLARLPVQRDNYKSRDARVDLAFARWDPASWIRLEGGRFVQPVPVTEMIWDRDLRAQGVALTLKHTTSGPVRRMSFTTVATRGGHVFDDGNTGMLILAGTLGFGDTGSTNGEVTGAWIGWDRLQELAPELRRQNTRISPGGPLEWPFHVVDLVGRLRTHAGIPLQLVAEVCRNVAAPDERDGLWLAAVLGSRSTSRLTAEYIYAWVDPNATLGAYAADDFLWTTGWEGHRLDLGGRVFHQLSLHAVGFHLRFKDAPAADDRAAWVDRLRLEVRFER